MFGAVSNRDLENIDKYFQQLIDFLSYEKTTNSLILFLISN